MAERDCFETDQHFSCFDLQLLLECGRHKLFWLDQFSKQKQQHMIAEKTMNNLNAKNTLDTKSLVGKVAAC